MNDIFKLRNTDRLTREKYRLNLEIRKPNQDTFGTRSLRSYGPKIWNALPYHIKTSDNSNSFKSIIKCWEGNYCNCRVCEHTTSNIRLQGNRLSQNIILKYLILYEIQCEKKIL